MLPTIVVGETTLLGWMGSERTGSVVKNQHALVSPPPLVLCVNPSGKHGFIMQNS